MWKWLKNLFKGNGVTKYSGFCQECGQQLNTYLETLKFSPFTGLPLESARRTYCPSYDPEHSPSHDHTTDLIQSYSLGKNCEPFIPRK